MTMRDKWKTPGPQLGPNPDHVGSRWIVEQNFKIPCQSMKFTKNPNEVLRERSNINKFYQEPPERDRGVYHPSVTYLTGRGSGRAVGRCRGSGRVGSGVGPSA